MNLLEMRFPSKYKYLMLEIDIALSHNANKLSLMPSSILFHFNPRKMMLELRHNPKTAITHDNHQVTLDRHVIIPFSKALAP